jgi:hypothetical protein
MMRWHKDSEDSRMPRTLNVVVRVVRGLIGLFMFAVGVVWMLQGFNLAFRDTLMAGDRHSAVYGAIFALLGAALIVLSIIDTRTGRSV